MTRRLPGVPRPIRAAAVDVAAADAMVLEAADVGVAQPSLVTLPNVELLEVGQAWETSTGVFDFTAEDLVSCIESQQDPSLRTPVVKLGHVDPRFDGQPSLGRILNLRLTNNNMTLVGDLAAMPLWLAQVMYSAYPRRSIEGNFDVATRTGNRWPMILTGVALLGEAYPAIDTLEDIQALWGATPPTLYPVSDVEEIAASGSFFRARKVDDMPNWLRRTEGVAAAGPAVQASTNLDSVRRAFYDAPDTGMWWWIREVRLNPLTLIVDDDEGGLFEVPVTIAADDSVTFGTAAPVKVEYVAASGVPVAARQGGQLVAASYEQPEDTGRKARASGTEGATMVPTDNTNQEGPNTMDLTPEELAALGLPADATREQISAAILGQAPAASTETPDDGNPASQPQTPSDSPAAQPATAPATDAPAPADNPATPATAPVPQQVQVPEGMVLVDAATLEEMRTGIAASNALVKRTEKADRDAMLDGAIRAGKFPPARRAHYETLLLSDPLGGKAILASLAPGLVPVAESGAASSETDVTPDTTSYPTGWGASVAAARKGLGSTVKVVND